MDECANSEDNCLQECVNDQGSFHCDCFPGFTLNADEFSCRGMYARLLLYVVRYISCNNIYNADLDECIIGTHRCSQDCKNTKGSYQCFCNNGYILNNNGITCDGKINNIFECYT